MIDDNRHRLNMAALFSALQGNDKYPAVPEVLAAREVLRRALAAAPEQLQIKAFRKYVDHAIAAYRAALVPWAPPRS